MIDKMRIHKKNKNIQLILCLVISALLFTGCSKLSREKHLNFYHYDMVNKDIYEELAEEYSENNKYSIRVKAVPRDTYLSTIKEDEKSVDIFLLPEEDLPDMLEDKKTSKKFANLKRFAEEEFDNFFHQVGRKKGWFREKTLALPYNYDIPIILYNKDLFELYNLEEPEDLEEFTDVCLTLDDNKEIPLGIQSKEDLLDVVAGVLINSEDGSRLIIEEGKLSSGFEDLFELSANFQERNLFNSDSINNNKDLLEGFINGDYAMFSGTLEDMKYLDSEAINYSYFNMPGYIGSSKGSIKVSSLIAISSKANSSKEAKNFVAFLMEDYNQNRLSVRADGFTIYPRQYIGDKSPEEIYSFAEELYLSPSLFQNKPEEEREIYLKEIDKMFSHEFKDVDTFTEKLKSQLQ